MTRTSQYKQLLLSFIARDGIHRKLPQSKNPLKRLGDNLQGEQISYPYIPKLVLSPDLAPHIRDCLWSYRSKNDEESFLRQTDFEVSFLGTGSSTPSQFRAYSATMLRLGRFSYLFDVGEGTHRQISFTRAKSYRISKIFITHLHGDHIFGSCKF